MNANVAALRTTVAARSAQRSAAQTVLPRSDVAHAARLRRAKTDSRMLTILITAFVTLIVVLVIANLSSGEKKIEHNIERLYAQRRPAIFALDGPVARAARHSGQPFRGARERRRDFSVDARRHPLGAKNHHVRNVHLLVRRDRRTVRPCARRQGARRRRGACAARLGGLVEDGPSLSADAAATPAPKCSAITSRTGPGSAA